MNDSTLLLPILVPLLAGVITLLLRRGEGVPPLRVAGILPANRGQDALDTKSKGKMPSPREIVALATTAFTLVLAAMLYNHEKTFSLPWAGFGMEFLLWLYHFSSFILLAAAGFSFLVVLYCVSFMRGREHVNQFYAYLLLTLAFVNGAVLADNLVLLLFFWEGLLGTLFGLIALGGQRCVQNRHEGPDYRRHIGPVSDVRDWIGRVSGGHDDPVQDESADDAAGQSGVRFHDDRGHLQGRVHALP